MRVSAKIDGLDVTLEAEMREIGQDLTEAMGEATLGLKDELREQMVSAGLGRIAKTWRSEVYPKAGDSLEPAGFVWSSAPRIVSSFITGETIEPALMNFLAIPTKNVPRRVGSRGKAQMGPRDVERSFGQKLIIRPGRNGTFIGYINAVEARSKKRPGYRRATPGRLSQGRSSELVRMFVFTPRARMPKLLKIDAAARRWADQVPSLFDARRGRGR
jgi:hypothetical protein